MFGGHDRGRFVIIFCLDEYKHCLPIITKNLSYIEITTRYSKGYYISLPLYMYIFIELLH